MINVKTARKLRLNVILNRIKEHASHGYACMESESLTEYEFAVLKRLGFKITTLESVLEHRLFSKDIMYTKHTIGWY